MGTGAVLQLDGRRRALLTVSVMMASMLQAIDTTIANVALPRIQGSMSATQDQMAWVLTSYIVAVAIATPVVGWLAGQIGRRRVFLFSIAGFTATSLLCGLAQSLPQIVVTRLLQGLSGAALIPMSQAVMLDAYPPARQARAMTLWVMGTVMGPIIGPALGGWLTESYDWRWVFFINLPVGVLAWLGVAGSLPETTTPRSRFDAFGFVALSLGVGALQLLLDRGQRNDWFESRETWIEATIAAVTLYGFFVHMLTAPRPPFISPALFRDRNFVTGNVLVFVIGVVLFATLALLPTLMQDLLAYPVVTAGMIMAPRGMGTLSAMLIVGRLIARLGVRPTVGIGMLLTAVSLWQMSGFDLQMGAASFVWAGALQGLGVGLVYAPLAPLAFATLKPALRNEGTALFNLARNVGSSIGISVVESLLVRKTQLLHARLAEHLSPYDAATRSALAGTFAGPHGLARLNAWVTRQAAMIAYTNDFKLMMLLTLASMPLLLLLRPGAHASEVVAVE